MFTDEQIRALRPCGWDLREPFQVWDDTLDAAVTIPAWTTVATVLDDDSLHWPVRTHLCRVAVLTGEHRGRVFDGIRTSRLARALGHR
jgi:hypothetical protein